MIECILLEHCMPEHIPLEHTMPEYILPERHAQGPRR